MSNPHSQLHIAIFTDVFLGIPGGIPSSIRAQKASLEALGHQVTIFCPGTQKDYSNPLNKFGADHDPNIILVPTAKFLVNGAPFSKWTKYVTRFIEKKYPNLAETFDLFHVHYEATTSMAGLLLAKKYGIKVIQTMHGREDMAIAINVPHPLKTLAATGINLIHRATLKSITKKSPKPDYQNTEIKNLAPTIARREMWQMMVRQANLADQVITPSAHFAKKLQLFGVTRPISVISNGINDQEIANFTPQIRTYQNDEPLRILWFSRLSKEKRILPFLESLRIAQKLKPDFRFIFTIIGDGNQMSKVQKFCKKHFDEASIKILGTIPHQEILQKYTKDQHLSIINSYQFDTQGLTILEAAACNLPVIYADPDMSEIVPNHGGLCAKSPAPRAMAELLLEIYHQPELIQKLSQNLAASEKTYLQSHQIEKLLKLYRQLS
ncbi:glycosyltransferase [Candidatus Saccharibacteria bacterium]|nr:glycosyltransferase [Candidatus Saccharibacteria bacterium]